MYMCIERKKRFGPETDWLAIRGEWPASRRAVRLDCRLAIVLPSMRMGPSLSRRNLLLNPLQGDLLFSQIKTGLRVIGLVIFDRLYHVSVCYGAFREFYNTGGSPKP